MILDLHGEPSHADRIARAFGDRPAFQHAVELEPEVVVKLSRRVPLDDERQRLRSLVAHARVRFWRRAEVALARVIGQRITAASCVLAHRRSARSSAHVAVRPESTTPKQPHARLRAAARGLDLASADARLGERSAAWPSRLRLSAATRSITCAPSAGAFGAFDTVSVFPDFTFFSTSARRSSR